MSFSSYDPHTRYKKRAIGRIKYAIVRLSFIVLAFGAGFWFGGNTAIQDITLLKQQISDHQHNEEALEQALTKTSAEAQTALMRYEQLQETVSETIPLGPMQDLLGLLRQQLDSGVDPKRLAFVIRSSRPPQNCSEPQNRRFIVQTPAYEGAESILDVADGLIKVHASGRSAVGKGGKVEAWFDSTKSVDVEFRMSDGRIEKKSGALPLQKYLIVNNREYRFTIEQGEQSFARAVYDSCDYP